MDPHDTERTKKKPFHDIEEFSSSEYDSERDDSPLFEAQYSQSNTLERAWAYSQVLIEKGESKSASHCQCCRGSDCPALVILLIPVGSHTQRRRSGQSRKTHYTLAICLALLGFFGLVFISRPSSTIPTETAVANATTLPLTYNRILSASMLFGITSPTYKRAIETHKRQAQRWGYGTEILQRDEGCGFWTKLIFLLNLVGQELQKPAETRAEWIM